jgi:hypothetical protein
MRTARNVAVVLVSNKCKVNHQNSVAWPLALEAHGHMGEALYVTSLGKEVPEDSDEYKNPVYPSVVTLLSHDMT